MEIFALEKDVTLIFIITIATFHLPRKFQEAKILSCAGIIVKGNYMIII